MLPLVLQTQTITLRELKETPAVVVAIRHNRCGIEEPFKGKLPLSGFFGGIL